MEVQQQQQAAVVEDNKAPTLPRTRQLVDGILARLDLLLHVNISPAETSLPRTLSQCIEAIKTGDAELA